MHFSLLSTSLYHIYFLIDVSASPWHYTSCGLSILRQTVTFSFARRCIKSLYPLLFSLYSSRKALQLLKLLAFVLNGMSRFLFARRHPISLLFLCNCLKILLFLSINYLQIYDRPFQMVSGNSISLLFCAKLFFKRLKNISVCLVFLTLFLYCQNKIGHFTFLNLFSHIDILKLVINFILFVFFIIWIIDILPIINDGSL